MEFIIFDLLPAWAQSLPYLIIALVLGLFVSHAVMRFVLWWMHKTTSKLDHTILRQLKVPVHVGLPVGFVFLGAWLFHPGLYAEGLFLSVAKISFVIFMAWLLIGIIKIFASFMRRRYNVNTSDNLRARGIHTQINLAQRVAVFIVVLLAIASLFLFFNELRGIGVSMIASAGVAGIIIGFAAQKALGNLMAGIQIAITQPMRIDDVVIVEGEWGWVEEITLTYVVVRIWDLRRLILPISYFIENPFQNWTRQSATILGTVFLYTDYTMPIEPIREKMTELLHSETGQQYWRGEVNVVQVTDSKEDTMEIRCLIDTRNSPDGWELRVFLREELIKFIQSEYPHALPKTRARLEREGDEEIRATQMKTA